MFPVRRLHKYLLALTTLCAGCNAMPPVAGDVPVMESVTRSATTRARATALLAAPLSQDAAVELALIGSPALSAHFMQLAIDPKNRLRVAHVPDPRYDAGRALGGAEAKIERPLTANLASWLALPALRPNADDALMAVAVNGIGDRSFATRRTWVRAVAARQALQYAQDVVLAAEVGADLAQRMRQVGSSAPLDGLRTQQFHERALALRARATVGVALEREQLLQLMGVWGVDSERLQLPDRLPDLPQSSQGSEGLEALALSQRLDLQIARAALSHDSATTAEPAVAHVLQQEALDQAGIRARAEVRSSWLAYQAQHGLARHACEVGVPLAQRISEEQLKRYNGMLSSVFDLLADATNKIRAVSDCLDGLTGFWLAEVDLQQALAGIGRLPSAPGITQLAADASAHPQTDVRPH